MQSPKGGASANRGGWGPGGGGGAGFVGCFGGTIDGHSCCTWWFHQLPGPSICPKRTPMGEWGEGGAGVRWFGLERFLLVKATPVGLSPMSWRSKQIRPFFRTSCLVVLFFGAGLNLH